MLRIGEYSKLAKTTVKTLRFYDEIGLFKPAFVDGNGYRYYSIDDLSRLTLIVRLRRFGIPVEDVKSVMDGGDLQKVLRARRRAIETEIAEKKQSLSLLEQLSAYAEKGEIMNRYEAKDIVIPAYTVYCRHGVIENMADMTKFILEAGAECAKNNPDLRCLTPDYCFVTYEAGEFQENDVELEYAQAIERAGRESENIRFKELPETRAVSVVHKGEYAKLGEAYAYALQKVQERGLRVSGKIRERYVHGCWDSEHEADYVTEIQIPVE